METHITDWKQSKTKSNIYHIDKDVICLNVNKSFQISEDKLNKSKDLYVFQNNRRLFKKELPVIINYIDYFMEFYDYDNDLISIYIKLKYDIYMNELHNLDTCKHRILSYLFNKSRLKEKLTRLVDDNYHLDLTVVGDRVFTGSKDFTNDEGKVILCASMMMKLSIPIVAHIVSTNKAMNSDDRHKFICEIFTDIFYKMCGEEKYISIISKLYYYISSKVGYHSIEHEPMWDKQGAIGGWTESNFIDNLLHSHILYLNLFKLNFKDNLMGFFKIIIEDQLRYNVSRVKHKKNIVSMSIDYSVIPNDMANIDKWEQFMVKIDESQLILSDVSIKYMIELYELRFGIIHEEEIGYYRNHLKLKSKFHSDLIFGAVAKDFMGYREVHNMDIRNYIKLVIITKRKLNDYMYSVLPVILSSNIDGKVNTNIVRNAKFIKSIQESSIYRHLMDDTYSTLKNDKHREDYMLDLIKVLLTSKFTYVEYESQDLLGTRIKFDTSIVVDELLTFIDTI